MPRSGRRAQTVARVNRPKTQFAPPCIEVVQAESRRVGAVWPEKRCASRHNPMQLDALSDN